MNQDNPKLTVGKYLITPLVKLMEDGWYATSVSIRSGVGSGTHDRVLRLTQLFRDRLAAIHYATGEGLQWVGNKPAAASGLAL